MGVNLTSGTTEPAEQATASRQGPQPASQRDLLQRAVAARASVKAALRQAGCTREQATVGALWAQGLGAERIARRIKKPAAHVQEILKSVGTIAKDARARERTGTVKQVLKVYRGDRMLHTSPEYVPAYDPIHTNWRGPLVSVDDLMENRPQSVLALVERALI